MSDWPSFNFNNTINQELEESKKTADTPDKVIVIEKEDEEYIKAVERRLLLGAVSTHVISAAAVYGIAKLTKEQYIKEHTSLLFLGSALVRPLIASHRYLKERLMKLKVKVTFPRDDVNKVRSDVYYLTDSVRFIQNDLETKASDIRGLRNEINALQSRIQQSENALRAVSQKFEETVSQISKDQMMIQGVRQFIQSVVKQEE